MTLTLYRFVGLNKTFSSRHGAGVDVLYISHERLAQASRNDFFDVPPELVVEVMSPHDRWSEVRLLLWALLVVSLMSVGALFMGRHRTVAGN